MSFDWKSLLPIALIAGLIFLLVPKKNRSRVKRYARSAGAYARRAYSNKSRVVRKYKTKTKSKPRRMVRKYKNKVRSKFRR